VRPEVIETYGGQPNKQAADLVTTFDPGRMIWHGYTGAAGWMFRQALEGVLGLRLRGGEVLPPSEALPAVEPRMLHFSRDVTGSHLRDPEMPRPGDRNISPDPLEVPMGRKKAATREGERR